MTTLLVVLGAAIGAPARYLVDRAIRARHNSPFPWGTWCANVAGSFLLGAVAAEGTIHGGSGPVLSLVGVGFCGALTTYSTFSYETVRLLENKLWFFAAANAVANIVAGLGAAYCGIVLAAAF